jgi:hypothetical protein
MTLRKVRRTRLHDLRKSDQPLTLVAACCCKSAGCMTLQNPPSGGCMSLQTGTRAEAAARLNDEGFTTGAGTPFNAAAVAWLQRRWGLKTYRDHLLARGYVTTDDMAALLGITAEIVRRWRSQGRLHAARYNDNGAHLFEPLERQPDDIRALAARKQSVNRKHS